MSTSIIMADEGFLKTSAPIARIVDVWGVVIGFVQATTENSVRIVISASHRTTWQRIADTLNPIIAQRKPLLDQCGAPRLITSKLDQIERRVLADVVALISGGILSIPTDEPTNSMHVES